MKRRDSRSAATEGCGRPQACERRDNRQRAERTAGGHCGFTLVEVLVVLAVLATTLTIGLALMLTMLGNLKFNASVRDVQSELQTARLKAVSSNRPMRLRFDCPAAGQFRMVELIGSPGSPDALDAAANRCSETAFPLVPVGSNVLARPNQDGAVRRLRPGVTFTASMTIEFWPDGTAHADTGAGNPWPQIAGDALIRVTYKTMAKTITVNGVGKVQIQ